MTPEAQAGRHLESGEVASYLDRALAPREQARVETHLADCAACRREVVEVSRLRHASGSRRRWFYFAPAAAAAAILILVLAHPANPPGRGPVLRDGRGEPGPTVALVAPGDSAAVNAAGLSFTWRSAGRDASYRITLADERGDVVWSAATSDTALVPSTQLRAGKRYFWYVDALLPDGRSVTSRVRRLTLR